MLLSDAIYPSNALLELHRVPRQVVIDHHMAELEVEALAARVGRDQHLRLACERILNFASLVHVERAVQTHYRESPIR